MTKVPPRLIAIADGSLWREHAGRAQLAFAVGRLAAACRGRSWQTGLLLRHHGWHAAQWLAALEELSWLEDFGLVLGISAPVGPTSVEQFRQLTLFGVGWVQVPEALAASWDSVSDPGDGKEMAARPAFARSCHDLSGATAALAAGASWAMLSPVLPTPSKPDTAALGWPTLAAVTALFPQRIVALGGLDAATAGQALRCGAAGVAVLRAWRDQPTALVDALGDA